MQEISRNGVEVQLRHSSSPHPEDEEPFREEIQENRSTIQKATATEPVPLLLSQRGLPPVVSPMATDGERACLQPLATSAWRGAGARASCCRVSSTIRIVPDFSSRAGSQEWAICWRCGGRRPITFSWRIVIPMIFPIVIPSGARNLGLRRHRQKPRSLALLGMIVRVERDDRTRESG